MILAAGVGAIAGAVGGLMMLLVVAYALERTLFDRFDRLLFTLALIVGLLATILALSQAARGSRGGYDGLVLMAVAAAGLVVTIVRDVRRMRWLAKPPADWTIEPFDTTTDETLPNLVTSGDDVLVRHDGANGGPFRGTSKAERIVRFDRVLAPRILRRRIFLAAAAIVVMGVLAPRFVMKRIIVAQHETRPAPRHPTVIEGLGKTTTQIVVANDYACAVTDQRLRCWGNDAGPRTQVPGGPQWTAVEFADAPKVERVVASNSGFCLWAAPDEVARCWSTQNPPLDLDVLRDAFALGRTSEGHVWWSGDDKTGLNVDLTRLRDIKQLAASDHHACALDRAGAVYCWGTNLYGCVNGDITSHEKPLPPAKVEDLPKIDRIVLGTGATWAYGGGRWYSWGHGRTTEYSRGHGSNVTLLPETPRIRDVVVTATFTCILHEDGSVVCEPEQWADDSTPRMHMDSLPPGDTVEIAGWEAQLCARGVEVRCWGPYRL